MLAQAFAGWISALHEQAMSTCHRQVIVLSGDMQWCVQRVEQASAVSSGAAVLWVSAQLPAAMSPKKAHTQLGQEYDSIVFDAYQRVDADALGAISGTLRGGGLLWLLIPDYNDWNIIQSSRFHRRLWSLLQHQPGVYFIHQADPLPQLQLTTIPRKPEEDVVAPFRTSDQQRVVTEIESRALKLKQGSIVLISDRGRGKSSALGLAAGRLLQQGFNRIIVTAPRLTTSDPLFEQARRMCPDAKNERGLLQTSHGQLKFMAPDALLLEQPEADLLLVDEAAAIPLSLLETFLQRYPLIVFSTTVHGYEGTGRGFALKFNRILDAESPGWQQLSMDIPIRWASQDPVESWIDKLLCLDVELTEVPTQVHVESCSVELLDRDDLLKHGQELATLFALLVNAHYRTQSSDLVHLLDDDKVRIYTLNYQGNLLGAVLINEEGGYDQDLSSAIYRGMRRPTGNLLPQTLTFHAGCEQAATLSYARIMRIAIHPLLQNQGFGSYFLSKVIRQEQKYVDAIGSSFGATVELLRFWKRAGFELLRIGFTRDHVSGTHSAVMLMALNKQAEAVQHELRQKFRRYLPAWLNDPLADLPEDMKLTLVADQLADDTALTESDWQEIHSFASSHRGYEAVMWPLKKFFKHNAVLVEHLAVKDRQVIQARVIHNMSWSQTVSHVHASGVAEAVQRLRQAVKALLAEQSAAP